MRIPEPLRSQVVEGRLAAMEVPPRDTDNRAFVIIRPVGGATTLEESLRMARVSGSIEKASGFVVSHTEYDADRLEGWDYDIGQVDHARVEVEELAGAEALLLDWGYDPTQLQPYNQTDAP